MNTKQKRTLLGAVVALILVGTIVATVLSVYWSSTTASKNPTDPAVEEVWKVVKNALENTGHGKEYVTVYIQMQEQWLDKNSKVTHVRRHLEKFALKKVTVLGIKNRKVPDVKTLIKVLGEKKDSEEEVKTVIAIKAVVFKDDAIMATGGGGSYPVLEKLMKDFKLEANVEGWFGTFDDFAVQVKVGDPNSDMLSYKRIMKK